MVVSRHVIDEDFVAQTVLPRWHNCAIAVAR